MDEHTYVVNVDGVVVSGDEYLLIERATGEEHAPGMLAFPGGKVEAPPGTDDVIKETARRELAEEVGITVGQVDYVGSRTFTADAGTECINVVVLCEHLDGEARPRATDEVASVHWLSAEEIIDRDPPAFFIEYIEQIEAFRAATDN